MRTFFRECLGVPALVGGIMSSPLIPASVLPDDHSSMSHQALHAPQVRSIPILEHLPPCAALCLFEHCKPQNTTCVCGVYKDDLNKCILAACPVPQAIFSRNITETACQTPVRDRSTKYSIMAITLAAFSSPAILARLVFKRFFSAQRCLDYEDWTIMAVVPIGLTAIAISLFGMTQNGLGVDLWGLQPQQLADFGLYFFIEQLFYVVIMTLLKLALTLFYLKVFAGRGIRILLWVTVTIHALMGFGFAVIIVFQCTPIVFQWERYDFSSAHPTSGHCIEINAGVWVHGALNVASDLWLLAVPLSQIIPLRLPWRKRIGASLMFMTGTIATIVSFLRFACINKYSSTSNSTWDEWDLAWWSCIELHVGAICTCLPTLRLILIRIAAKMFGTELRSTRPKLSGRKGSMLYHLPPSMTDPAPVPQDRALMKSILIEPCPPCDMKQPQAPDAVHLETTGHMRDGKDVPKVCHVGLAM